MNIYEKIQNVKEELLKSEIKKSGENKFAGFTYYELSDITPALIAICNKYKIFTSISFTRDVAILTIVNIENVEETLTYTSPMEELELKGCNKIQALGGTETYQRRYLYMTAFDITEGDLFDAISGSDKNEEIDYKKQLQEYVEKNKLNKLEIFQAYKLSAQSTQRDFKKALEDLKNEN